MGEKAEGDVGSKGPWWLGVGGNSDMVGDSQKMALTALGSWSDRGDGRRRRLLGEATSEV